jgi:tetratricopeptide (TPR) repeat protein
MTNASRHLHYKKALLWRVLTLLLTFSCAPVFSEPVDFEIMEQHSGADYVKGYKLQQEGKLEEAVQAYSKSIAAHPENTQTYMIRAGLLIGLKKFKEAQTDLNKYKDMIQQTSDKEDKGKLALLALREGTISDGLGNSAEALRKYQLALRYEDTIAGHKALGSLYKRQGKNELAIKELQQVKQRMNAGGWGYNWGKAETEIDEMLKELKAVPTVQTKPSPVKKSAKKISAH